MTRFTVTVDPELLDEARRLAKAKSNRETLELALREYIRSRRAKQLADLAGSGLVDMDLADLERWRASGERTA